MRRHLRSRRLRARGRQGRVLRDVLVAGTDDVRRQRRLWGACGTGMYGSSPSDNCAKPNHCQVSCTEARCCEGPGHWGEFKKRYCKRYVCLAIERTVQSQQECLAADFNWASDDEFYWCENERYCRDC